MILQKLNCAGQGCDERDNCRRYEVRVPDRILKVGEREFPIHEWASFDIESQHFGSCPHRIPWYGEKRKTA